MWAADLPPELQLCACAEVSALERIATREGAHYGRRLLRGALLLIAAAIASGCAQEIVVSEDATSRDVSSRDADGGIREDDAGFDQDAEPADVAGEDAGDGGVLRWSEMVFAPPPRELQAVWGRSATEVYAGAGSGVLYRWDGAMWAEQWRDPQNLGIRDIWGTSEILYVVNDRSIRRFEGGAVSTVTHAPSRSINAVMGFGADDLYAVISEQLTTRLFHYDGQNFTPVYEPQGVGQLYCVYGSSRDELYFGGSNGALFRLSQGVVDREQVIFPNGWNANDISMMEFRFITRLGGFLLAGGSQHLIFSRGVDGAWRPLYTPNEDRPLFAAAGNDLEIYAAGGGASYGPIVRYALGRWTPQNLTDQWELTDIFSATPDLYFAVGWMRNGVQGVALIGRR